MTLDDLNAAGFQHKGYWCCDEAGDAICRGGIPNVPGLYLFTVDSEIRYVGAALESLLKRMGSYQRRQRDGQSKRPVHVELRKTIRRDETVRIYVRETDVAAVIKWGDLPVSIILGAEAALIRAIDPQWNRRGRTTELDSKAVRGSDDDD
jgi:hypothetical protein